jgi:acetylornithine deacetylase
VIGAVGDRAEVREILCIPAIHFDRLDGFETAIVAYTTDVPVFGKSWGKPYLLGPGNIHVAHTSEERVSKKELLAASSIYQQMVKKLLAVT